MFSRLLVFLIVSFNCSTLDAQTVLVSPNDGGYNWHYNKIRGICTCVKFSVKSNVKSNYYNCFKLQEGDVFTGYRLIDEYYPSGQNKSSSLIRMLFVTCPEFIEAYNKFVLYPINFKESDLRRVLKKKKFKKWTEKYLAFNGVIIEEKTISGLTYHKIQLGDQFAWMHYPLSNQEIYGTIGAEVKAIGTLIFEKDSVIDSLEDADFYFSVFSVRNMSNYNTFYDPNYEAEFYYWRDKRDIPKYNKN